MQDLGLAAEFIAPQTFHVSLRQLRRHPSREAGQIDAAAVAAYYSNLCDRFRKPGEPINLELFRLLPTVNSEGFLTLIATYLPIGDLRIRQVRQLIETVGIDSQSLPSSEFIHTSIARFRQPPTNLESLLVTVAELNQRISFQLTATIDEFRLLSTTRWGYLRTQNDIVVDPPISLTIGNKPSISSRFRRIQSILKESPPKNPIPH